MWAQLLASFMLCVSLPVVWSNAESCGIVPGFRAHGKKLRTLQLQNTSVAQQDVECCAACAVDPECEFWVRGTRKLWCDLMHKWKTSLPQGETRSGFKGQDQTACNVVKLVYGVVGSIVKHINITLGQAITNFSVELPDEINCVLATTSPGNYVSILGNTKVLAVGGITVKGVLGSTQMLLEADPIFDIDLETCRADVSMPGIWNLGLGINNYGEHKSLTNWLSGPDHSNKRGDCSTLLPALPGQSLDGGKRIAYQEFNSTSGYYAQEVVDKECCEFCNANPDCEGFEIHDHDPGKTKVCYLHHFTEPTLKTHANWRGQTSALGAVEFRGGHNVGIDKGAIVFGETQEEIDANCAQLCEENEACEIWMAEVGSRTATCHLRSLNEKRGLLNKGILGIHGYSIINWLAKRALRSYLNKVLQHSHLCLQDEFYQKLVSIANSPSNSPDKSMKHNDGFVSLDVPDAFFSSFDPDNADSWTTDSFKVLEQRLAMNATDARLQFLVDEVLQDLPLSFAGPLEDQLGSPFGFFIGGLISKCVDNPDYCKGKAAMMV